MAGSNGTSRSDAASAGASHAKLPHRPLVGRLVQVFGLVNGARGFDERSQKETEERMEIDGECGCCTSWSESTGTYVLQTFNGQLASVPEENLREWSPPAAEEGGFDVAWPISDKDQAGQATAHFAKAVMSALAEKGYCVIQTFMNEEDREAAWESAQEQDRDFFRLEQEVETGYMGFDSNSKMAWLHPQFEEDGQIKRLEDGTIDNQAFDESEKLIDSLGSSIEGLAPSLGVSFSNIMNPLLRVSIAKAEEPDYVQESIREMLQDGDNSWTVPMQKYIYFSKRRSLCVMHLIENSGGDIWFYPKEGAYLAGGRRSMRIPATQNKLVIFRHDIMDYSYQVMGPSLALQAWFLQDIGRSQAINEVVVSLGELGDVGQVVCNPGPEVPDGPKVNIMALTTRLPGEVWAADQYWNMFAIGTDTATQWPATRWETELYYEQGADSVATGKAYTCHGGFTCQAAITQLDNDFFGIDETEARSMIPGQKMSLEVGYECLVAAGFTKHSLKGRRIGMWFGDAGPDWHNFQLHWAGFCPDVSPTTLGTSMACAATAGRIAHQFDICGPVSSYDTACSASLVAMNAAHLCMFDQPNPRSENAEALIVGVNTLLGPASFIGNCMATMLSHVGRCFTFNRSADGYQRGEGCGSIFARAYQGNKQDEDDRVCALIGTATNQDGRSASLTAPNGPAQQAVIKKSMRFAGINPKTVSIAECHGTGTALGDPIEVGALMAVMNGREVPILKTSAKTNICHLEAGAGIAGLTKCIMMINHGTAPPNCHFNCINSHLTITGYPVHFESEAMDVGVSSLYCGVSSFGFGGTNSRADVYGYATKGHKAVVKANLPVASVPRAIHIGQRLYVSGSWDNFSSHQAMEGGKNGTYTCAVAIGENRWEEFQLSCSKNKREVIHPLVPKADSCEQVVGPDYACKGLNFLIDGRKDGMPPGTIYQIEFTWADDKKSISWKPLASETALEVIQDRGEAERKFYLHGSWRKFESLQAMKQVGDGLYEAKFVIGHRNVEEFQIVRDKDYEQIIYPSAPNTSKTGVPVMGPDWKGKGKHWRIQGRMHQEVVVKLHLIAGQASVTVACPAFGERRWKSWEDWSVQTLQTFYADCSSGRPIPMVPDSQAPGIHTCQLSLDINGYASFCILADGDQALTLYPDHAGVLCGPDADSKDKAWHIHGSRNATYEVTLDMTGRDKTNMVSWRPVGEQAALTA